MFFPNSDAAFNYASFDMSYAGFLPVVLELCRYDQEKSRLFQEVIVAKLLKLRGCGIALWKGLELSFPMIPVLLRLPKYLQDYKIITISEIFLENFFERYVYETFKISEPWRIFESGFLGRVSP